MAVDNKFPFVIDKNSTMIDIYAINLYDVEYSTFRFKLLTD